MKKLFYTLITLIALCLTAPHYAMGAETDDAMDTGADAEARQGKKRKTDESQSIEILAQATVAKKAKQSTDKKSFTCTYSGCTQTFSYKGSLTRHMRNHTGDKPFKCTQCPKAFARKSYLDGHMRNHTGDKFTCTKCSKTFTQKSNLTTHMRSHTGNELFECTKCSKTFTQKSNLTRHMRNHTGDKPFKCTQCPKAFSYKSYLDGHMRNHTGDKFTCTECSKTFIQKHNLKRHASTHKSKKVAKMHVEIVAQKAAAPAPAPSSHNTLPALPSAAPKHVSVPAEPAYAYQDDLLTQHSDAVAPLPDMPLDQEALAMAAFTMTGAPAIFNTDPMSIAMPGAADDEDESTFALALPIPAPNTDGEEEDGLQISMPVDLFNGGDGEEL